MSQQTDRCRTVQTCMILYVCLILSGCTPARTSEQERIVAIAKAAVESRETWGEQADYETPRRDGAVWRVTVWRVPKQPGGYRSLTINDNGNVVAYHRGK